MYRILLARSGYYYVQKYSYGNYRRIGGFFPTKVAARGWANHLKYGTCPRPCCTSVVEYV